MRLNSHRNQLSKYVLHNWDTRRTHGLRCPNGVTAAFQSREIGGAGSTPTWGSYKTNDEVLAKLLTWGHVLGKHQVVRAGWGNSTGPVFSEWIHLPATRLAWIFVP